MNGDRRRAHLRLLRTEREKRERAQGAREQQQEAFINLLWHDFCEELQRDRSSLEDPTTRSAFSLFASESVPPSAEDDTELWMFVAQDTTPVQTADGLMTLHEFRQCLRAGSDIHVHRDAVLLCLMSLVAQGEAFYAEPMKDLWWSVSSSV